MVDPQWITLILITHPSYCFRHPLNSIHSHLLDAQEPLVIWNQSRYFGVFPYF